MLSDHGDNHQEPWGTPGGGRGGGRLARHHGGQWERSGGAWPQRELTVTPTQVLAQTDDT